MGIIQAVTKIPARELTRRVVWLGAYLAFLVGGPFKEEQEAKDVAATAVQDYEEKFPQS